MTTDYALIGSAIVLALVYIPAIVYVGAQIIRTMRETWTAEDTRIAKWFLDFVTIAAGLIAMGARL